MSVTATTSSASRDLRATTSYEQRMHLTAAYHAGGEYLHMPNSDAWFVDEILHALDDDLPFELFGQGAGENPQPLSTATCERIVAALADEARVREALTEHLDGSADEQDGAADLLRMVATLAQRTLQQGDVLIVA